MNQQNDNFYLAEAFQQLKCLNEDAFDLSADKGVVDELQSFVADDIEAPFEEEIIESQTFEAFVATLSERDQQILQFKSEGFTLKEIAAKVGYQNHSAVSKRIHHISEKYSEYRNQ